MEENIELRGKLSKEIYRNDENYFSVVLFRVIDNEETITVTGYLPRFEEDTVYILQGNYAEHPRFGIQFVANKWIKQLPDTNEAIIRYLSGPSFIGIGRKMATSIVEKVGEDTINKIKEDHTVLDGIPKLSKLKKQVILDNINLEEDDLSKLMNFFILNNLSIRNITRINKTYGTNAIEVIKENPYRLFYECDGFGFKSADLIAKTLNFDLNDPLRIEAILLDLSNNICMSSGDSYILVNELENYFNKILNKDNLNADFYETLQQCLYRNTLILENDKVYIKSQYEAKDFISEFLSEYPFELMNPYDEHQLELSLDQIQDILNIRYQDKQMEAIRVFFDSNLMILTGGPGTGKTTVVRGLVHIFKQLYPYSTICCSAPTGRAAKRLSELTDTSTNTIHSLLQWDLETNTFGKNEKEPLLIDLLIIDEFSMVDNWLFYNLLKASVHVKKICIIGDEDQLPSVGPGCLLRDLINTNIWPLVRLDHIFRQQEGSGVIKLASDIKHDCVDFKSYESDVAFYKIDNYSIVNNVVNIVKSALDKGYSLNDIQVLSCKYKGSIGIDVLNANLQNCFNPKEKGVREFKFGPRIFRENDKILQLKNQPDDNVYNGDIGTLISIEFPYENDLKQTVIYVDYDGTIVEYSNETFINITHAYCISIHKSQGSEYPIVILPISMENYSMLEKRLIYTAITRAKKSVVILGDESAFFKGLEVKEKHDRKSDLTLDIINKIQLKNENLI